MYIKLSQDIGFSAVVIDGSKIYPNYFTLKINMVFDSNNSNSFLQNIAIQRIEFFLNEILNGSILCKVSNPIANKFMRIAKNNTVILLPEEPFDQVIGMVLYSKLNAIVEGILEIDTLTIGSEFAPDITYTIEDFEDFKFEDEKIDSPWWERADATISNVPKLMKKTQNWSDIGLGWEENPESEVTLEFTPIIDTTDTTDRPDVIILEGGGINGQS